MRGMVVAPAVFARQMWLLKRLGYRALSMRELEPYLDGRAQGRVVGITFDDGYLNNLQYALPVLRACGFSATCYAVSGAMGKRNSWDEVSGVPQKPLMNVEQMRAWLADGMDVGGHTRSHIDLTTLNAAAAKTEIAGCKHDLEACLQTEVRHFCYPYGRHTSQHREMARSAGYVSATTVNRGRSHAGDDPFALPRVLIARSTHVALFWLKLTSSYEDRRA
jgi:peptidoglycan/xylan/chitin deacetylase (PgdA/CDA1 family)